MGAVKGLGLGLGLELFIWSASSSDTELGGKQNWEENRNPAFLGPSILA